MKCPNCGKILEDITFFDFENYDGKVYATYKAHCHDCHSNWHWEDVYEYTETTIPYQIHSNDHL